MCLIDVVSCTILVLGILISVFYLYLSRIEEPDPSKNPEKQPTTPKWKENPDLFKLQYEQICEGIRNRDNVTIVAGTILVTASVLLLGTCIQLVSQKIIDYRTKILMIFASLGIYVIWLVCFNLTSTKVNSIDYSHLRSMEKDPPQHINIHTYRLSKVKDRKWWKYLRQKVWLYFLWVLIIVSIVILSIPV